MQNHLLTDEIYERIVEVVEFRIIVNGVHDVCESCPFAVFNRLHWRVWRWYTTIVWIVHKFQIDSARFCFLYLGSNSIAVQSIRKQTLRSRRSKKVFLLLGLSVCHLICHAAGCNSLRDWAVCPCTIQNTLFADTYWIGCRFGRVQNVCGCVCICIVYLELNGSLFCCETHKNSAENKTNAVALFYFLWLFSFGCDRWLHWW